MTANKKESELSQIDQITIVQKGEEFLKDQAMMEEMLQQLSEYRKRNDKLQAEVDRLNKVALESSVPYQQMKAQNTILIEYLRTWLQTFESKFDSDEDQELTEAHDYLTHAKWMEVNCGRNCYGFIRRVQEWYDSQPAWKQRPKVSVE